MAGMLIDAGGMVHGRFCEHCRTEIIRVHEEEPGEDERLTIVDNDDPTALCFACGLSVLRE